MMFAATRQRHARLDPVETGGERSSVDNHAALISKQTFLSS
jgi:hypothetical protein